MNGPSGLAGILEERLDEQDQFIRDRAAQSNRASMLAICFTALVVAGVAWWLTVTGSGGAWFGSRLEPQAALSIGSGLIAGLLSGAVIFGIDRYRSVEEEKRAQRHRAELVILGQWVQEKHIDEIEVQLQTLRDEIDVFKEEVELNWPGAFDKLDWLVHWAEESGLESIEERLEDVNNKALEIKVELASLSGNDNGGN